MASRYQQLRELGLLLLKMSGQVEDRIGEGPVGMRTHRHTVDCPYDRSMTLASALIAHVVSFLSSFSSSKSEFVCKSNGCFGPTRLPGQAIVHCTLAVLQFPH